jgi:hypothetical protein
MSTSGKGYTKLAWGVPKLVLDSQHVKMHAVVNVGDADTLYIFCLQNKIKFTLFRNRLKTFLFIS